MTLEEFETGLDRWGGALEAWPPSEQAAARALLGHDPRAAAAHRAMAALEVALARTAYAPAPSGDLLARASALPQERPALGLALAARRWRLAAGVAVLAAGFAYGATERPAQADDWFGPAFNAAGPFDDF